jgi:hypothetical protein
MESLKITPLEAIEPVAPVDEIEALETGLHEDGGVSGDTHQDEESGGAILVIEDLANELLKSAYLELWSVGLLRKEGTGEEQFLRTYYAYHSRVERCIDQRDHLLHQIIDLEPFETKVREAQIELDELDVRRSIGDLRHGEYEAKAPALRWTIDQNEAESERRRNRIALLENPFGRMTLGKVDEAAALVEEAQELIMKAETSEKLSSETAAKVRASIDVIEGFLKRTP